MSLINLFSNIWIIFINNPETDNIIKTRVIQTHGINEELVIDNLVKFWSGPGKGETYTIEITANLKEQKQTKLIAFWDALAKRVHANITNGAEPLLIVSTVMTSHECLIAFYLYFLKKYAGIVLEKSVKILASKIAGIQYTMSDEMKKIIYLICS
jgi:hypothetical protein